MSANVSPGAWPPPGHPVFSDLVGTIPDRAPCPVPRLNGEQDVPSMKSRQDDRYARTEFACFTGVPPYARLPIRSRSGLKHTAFHPTIGKIATDYKLHNTYLKPDFFTDPVEEYWAIRKTAGLLDVTGEEILEIKGPEAESLLDSVMPRNVRKMKDGHCYYSVLLHDYGGIVEDGILVRFDQNHFWWIGGPGNSEECLYMHGVHRDVSITSFNDSIHVASLQAPNPARSCKRCARPTCRACPSMAWCSARSAGSMSP